jgi:NADH:ubiquinone oxidoreductase subunit F (NADH-binding)
MEVKLSVKLVTEKSKGTKVFALAGKISKGGLIEVLGELRSGK